MKIFPSSIYFQFLIIRLFPTGNINYKMKSLFTHRHKPYTRILTFLYLITVFIISLSLKMNASSDELVDILILDNETGFPVSNASIKINDVLIAQSDSNGKASIIFSSEEIIISRLGYTPVNFKFSVTEKQEKLTVYMHPEGIKSANVIVTGHLNRSDFDKINNEQYALEGNDLKRNIKQTISESMIGMTNVNTGSMGSATSKPVIRGLDGNRLQFQLNETVLADLSGTSSDHAVNIEVSSAKKIELLRGADALRRSSDAAVGLIKITDNSIPAEKVEKTNIDAMLLAESVNSGASGALSYDVSAGDFAFHSEGSYRKHDNLLTPDKEVQNSGGKVSSITIGTSLIYDNFLSGISFSNIENEYEVPGGIVGAHPNGADISMTMRSINFRSILHSHGKLFDNIELNLSRTYYHHKEYESRGLLGAEFKRINYAVNLDFAKKSDDLNNNIDFGAAYLINDFNYGAFVFTPNTKTHKAALYYTQKIKFDSYSLHYGGRFDYGNFQAQNIHKNDDFQSRTFITYSANISISGRIDKHSVLLMQAGKNSRMPSIEELYSKGPHLASYTYEVGNDNLKVEESYSIELSYNYSDDYFSFFTSAYIYEYTSFISSVNTGDTNWAQVLPIYTSSDVKARIAGWESSFKIYPVRKIEIDANFAFNYGQNLNDNTPLAFFSPHIGNLSIKYKHKTFTIGVNSRFALNQNRVNRLEKATPGYVIYGLFADYKFKMGSNFHDIGIAIDNLSDAVYRNHLSRLKEILPEAGRNLRLIYKFYY